MIGVRPIQGLPGQDIACPCPEVGMIGEEAVNAQGKKNGQLTFQIAWGLGIGALTMVCWGRKQFSARKV